MRLEAVDMGKKGWARETFHLANDLMRQHRRGRKRSKMTPAWEPGIQEVREPLLRAGENLSRKVTTVPWEVPLEGRGTQPDA